MVIMAPPAFTRRLVKGSPETAQEMDDNFTNLSVYLQAQENKLSASLNADGSLKSPKVLAGVSATGNDTYTTTLQTTPTSYNDLKGSIILLTPDTANTGSATLQVSPLGSALEIRRSQDQALAQGDIPTNHVAVLVCDGTYFQLLNPARVPRANYHADSGSDGIAYVLASLPATFEEPAAYYAGYLVWVKANLTNVSTSITLKVGALAPVPVALPNGSSTIAKGLIRGGAVYGFIHDGTNFVLVSGFSAAYSALDGAAIANVAYTKNFAHGLGVVPTKVRVVVRANATDGVFSAGDEESIESLFDTGGTGPTSLIHADATNITVAIKRTGARTIVKKDGTGAQTFDETGKWAVKVYAEA